MSERFHIITGGPGSGKSSVIEALAAKGVQRMPEAGRAIIQYQVEIGGNAVPWGDRNAFADIMLAWEMRSYQDASRLSGPVFFDRGVPDVIGYLRVSGLSVPDYIMRAAELRRYSKRVFVAPHWPAIFVQDAERRQTAKEAAATHRIMVETYAWLGYEPVELPLASVAERVRFIQRHIC